MSNKLSQTLPRRGLTLKQGSNPRRRASSRGAGAPRSMAVMRSRPRQARASSATALQRWNTTPRVNLLLIALAYRLLSTKTEL